MSAAQRAPDGCMLVLPESWIRLDLDPETAEESLRRLVALLAHNDPSVAAEREGVARLLGTMVRDAVDQGAVLCAVHFAVDAEGRPVQCLLTVTLRLMDGPTDPAGLLETLADDGADAQATQLAAGPALRVSRRTEDGFLSLGMLVPAPGVEGGLGVISLLSPSLSHEQG